MTRATCAHGTFTLERTYPAAPARVFAAWGDVELKTRWFIGPEGWKELARELDFRVDGRELLRGRHGSGMETLFTARYHDLVRDERIVYVYDMHLDGKHHSVSLASVELSREGRGTRLVFTEQVVFLDGTEGAAGTSARERGTAAHLDRLAQRLVETG